MVKCLLYKTHCQMAVALCLGGESGIVERFYEDWSVLHRAHDRDRPDRSHPGFVPHAHSHIKLIAQRVPAEMEGH